MDSVQGIPASQEDILWFRYNNTETILDLKTAITEIIRAIQMEKCERIL